MDEASVSGTNIYRLHPSIHAGAVWEGETAIFVFDTNRVGTEGREDQIRFSQRPFARKVRQLRQVLVVSLRRASLDPCRYEIQVAAGEARVIRELAVAGDGLPGRHPALDDFFLDRLRPRARLCVGCQRHRSDTAGAVAAQATPGENPDDFLIKRDLRGDALMRVPR